MKESVGIFRAPGILDPEFLQDIAPRAAPALGGFYPIARWVGNRGWRTENPAWS